ncbi:tail fiber protein [uncultured Shewanella sp.]|uniref:tail fiber protein n=1 Tax=uncultured Shewanella sp. TaxID=173975 RepID=UPI0026272AD4|nr:tail fiber protein [uncultured Shewanella sp.]
MSFISIQAVITAEGKRQLNAAQKTNQVLQLTQAKVGVGAPSAPRGDRPIGVMSSLEHVCQDWSGEDGLTITPEQLAQGQTCWQLIMSLTDEQIPALKGDYDIYEVGFYLADGSLFALLASESPLLEKRLGIELNVSVTLALTQTHVSKEQIKQGQVKQPQGTSTLRTLNNVETKHHSNGMSTVTDDLLVEGGFEVKGNVILGQAADTLLLFKGQVVTQSDLNIESNMILFGDMTLSPFSQINSSKFHISGGNSACQLVLEADKSSTNTAAHSELLLQQQGGETLGSIALNGDALFIKHGASTGSGIRLATSMDKDLNNAVERLSIDTAGDVRIHEALNVDGALTVDGSATLGDSDTDLITISGSLTSVHSSGKLEVNDTLHVSQTLNVDGALTVDGSATLGDSDTDEVIINGQLRSTNSSGWLEVNDALYIREALDVSGNTTLGLEDTDEVKISGQLKSNHSSNAIEVSDALHVSETLSVDGHVTLGNEDTDVVTIIGSLVSGNSSNKLEINDAVHVSESLSVDGQTTLGNEDADSVTFAGTLISSHSSGKLEINDSVNISESLTVTDGLNVNGGVRLGNEDADSVTLAGALQSAHSSGSLELNDALHVSETLSVDGQTTLGNEDADSVTFAGALISSHSSGKVEVNDSVNISESLNVVGDAHLETSLQVGGSQKITHIANTAQVTPSDEILLTESAIHQILPKGSIIMWSGSAIPSGWTLCNGQNSTPDLRGRFIIGAGQGDGLTNRPLNQVSGSEQISLQVENIPSHNHSAIDSGHGHGVSDPGHDHQTDRLTSSGDGDNASDHNFVYHNGTERTGVNTTGIAINTGYANISIGNTGSNLPFPIIPPYYSLCFIMKLMG